MTFLPVVQRELRVAARKGSTFWLRVWAALAALLIGSAFLAICIITGTNSARFGPSLFGTLTWLALVTTIAAGLFFTADSLSEEKREGTLGFLFLTDLSGMDVVGGKLLATSLRGSYALLAIFPILGTTLLMGGVTGGQFWRSSLALVNALFYSLAVGLLVSALSRNSQHALAGTFFLLLFLCGVGPLIDSSLTTVRPSGVQPFFRYTSPAYVFWAATAWGRTGFWPALAISHLIAWANLVLSGFLVRRTWQDRPRKPAQTITFDQNGVRTRRASTRYIRRRRLLDGNPVVWLSMRPRWQIIAFWSLTVVMLLSVAALPFAVRVLWSQVIWISGMGLYVLMTSEACRFWTDARRSGLLELLAVTPLTVKDVIDGQWRGLLYSFGLPILTLVTVQAAGMFLSQNSSWAAMAAASGGKLSWLVPLAMSATAGATLVANLVALVWVGMWMGLTTINGSIASLKTLLFVQVLPWLGIMVASIMLSMLFTFSRMSRAGMNATAGSATFMISFPLILTGSTAALTLAKDAAWFFWARHRLRERFREQASCSFRAVTPTFEGQRPPIPPVISVQS